MGKLNLNPKVYLPSSETERQKMKGLDFLKQKIDSVTKKTPKTTSKNNNSDNFKSDPPKKKEKRPKTNKEKFLKSSLKFIAKCLLLVAFLLILLNFLIGINICHTTDNFPNLKDGDLVISYRLNEVHTGDLITYHANGRIRYGRIVASPGDVVEIGNEVGSYMVNGSLPYEINYYDTLPADGSKVLYPLTIEDGYYFVLNDYRDSTGDSRLFGPVPVENIIGRVVLTIRHRGF